ncbi:LCP family protein [Cellulomonas sp. ATA003]|uniref:LCP family protein n=1 Tax=Cellulomonas sp. ATA003 TaxID=3073064 RepID=UPI0028730A22|nr:LCP family protein [Cellulomonas sp. ATA003]WNB86305.1 LCP family protein [Cellulomonas sp. ATA003]
MRGAALGLTAVLAFGATGVAAAYTRLQTNIESVDVTALLGEDRPTPTRTPDPDDPHAGQALNILLIGSDVRDGENADLGGEVEGMRSDTTIVMHVAADRSRVELVSIPRDTLVDIPACPRSDGTTSRPQAGQFNAAFSIGSESGEVSDAAVCTILTVEENTGVFIDDYVVIDFAGFIRMIDALGGVPMCIPNDMRSPKAGLELAAGTHVLDGTTALAFARARTGEGVGNGSDIDRLGRQQQLLAATVQTVQSKNLLTDVPELLRFLNAATSSVTASPGLASIPDLSGLAWSVRGTLGGNIAFMTIPIAAAPSDPNRVVMTPEADQVWANLSADLPALTQPERTPAPPGAGTDAPVEPAPTPTPGQDAITADDVSTVCA